MLSAGLALASIAAQIVERKPASGRMREIPILFDVYLP